MCGIAGIILKQKGTVNLRETILSMTQSIAHRGPDGDGFMLADENSVTPFSGKKSPKFSARGLKYFPEQNINEAVGDFALAFGHRRLSIIDLSEAGHQPMCNTDGKKWIVFNGEIYNYLELKKELISLGHSFLTECDTEVILTSYLQWGFDCVKKFNGMWAFCIYDTEKQICFASRDRLGVKPFYFINRSDVFAFASEQKAFVKSGLIKASIHPKALHNYLVNGALESETDNFFEGVNELFPGNNLVYSLRNHNISINSYYSIVPSLENEGLSESELTNQISEKLERSVKWRLRSDVEVGTCLSGGIDSSVISALIHQLTQKSVYCFTSVFRNEDFNEEKFADIVAAKINAIHKKVEPDEKGFLKDMDDLVYSQDVPIWDTSTYAQFKVMQLAAENKIKVVLDGQGADELFAGYHHHFVAKWNNLFSRGNLWEGMVDISATGISIPHPFRFYLKEKLKQTANTSSPLIKKFYRDDFLNAFEVQNPAIYFNSVNEQLIHDIQKARLKSFLKCEDRCGMWHGVESRTPFSDDVDLIDFMFSFNGNRKIKNGVLKYLLREAAKPVLPKEIYQRYDKKGFNTPMHKWLKKLLPQMLEEVSAMKLDYLNNEYLMEINTEDFNSMKMLFKLFILSRWKKVFEA